MLVNGCGNRYLMRAPYRTLDRRRFGMRMVGCCSLFLLLCFSFAALCLSASNSQMAFVTDERQLSRSEASCCHDANVFHSCDVASPAHLHLKQDGLYNGQAGSLEDFFVRHVVLPFDAKDRAQAALVKPLQ